MIDINYIHSLQEEHLSNEKPVNNIDPLVSIYVTTYQQVDYISDCLDGILMQKTNFPFEIVLGEDQSTDGTRELCIQYAEKHTDKIRLFLRDRRQTALHDEKGVFYQSINGMLTAKSCRGKYIAMCEGDDYWTAPDKLQKQADFLESHPECSMCFHPVIVKHEDKGVKDNIFPSSKTHPFVYQNQFLGLEHLIPSNFIQTNSVMYRWRFKNEKDQGIIPVDIVPKDWFLHLLHAEKGKIGFIDEAMGVYRRHSGGMWRDVGRNNEKFYLQYGINMLGFYQEVERRWPEHMSARNKQNGTALAADLVKAYFRTQDIEKLNKLKQGFPEYYDRAVEFLLAVNAKLANEIKAEKKQNASLENENLRLRTRLEDLTKMAPAILSPGEKERDGVSSSCTGGTSGTPVSIIIPLFNGIESTQKCLEALFGNTPDGLYEVIIIDNASTDGTAEFLKTLTNRSIRVITNKEDKGFTAGCNQGIAEAKGDYIVLLNNDVVVTKQWLEQMISQMKRSPDIGLAGPVRAGVQDIQSSAKGIHDLKKGCLQDHRGEPSEHMMLGRFCILIRKEVLDVVGGLDENYINHAFEIDDLCLRSLIAGYKNVVVRDALVYCNDATSLKGDCLDYEAAGQEGRVYFAEKWKDIVEFDGDGYKIRLSGEKQRNKLVEWGEGRMARGDVKGAAKVFERVYPLVKDDYKALNNLGVIQWQLGEAVSAIKSFQATLAINPTYRDALTNLMNAAKESGMEKMITPTLQGILNQVQARN